MSDREMPIFLHAYLRSLNPAWAQEVWDWADAAPEAALEIIDVVAPVAAEGSTK